MDSRLLLAALCGGLQFFACVATALLLGFLPAWSDRSAWLLVVALPALAAALLPLIALVRPDVFAVGSLAFPLNLTLPIVHGALMIAVAVLMFTMKVRMMAVPERLAVLGTWIEPKVWLVAVGMQVVVLSVGVGVRRRAGR